MLLLLLVDGAICWTAGSGDGILETLGYTGILICILENAGILFLLVNGKKIKARLDKAKQGIFLKWILLAATPVFYMILVQLLVGQSFSLFGRYVWINLLLYYGIFLFLLLLTGRVRKASAIYGIFFLILGLTEFYVLQFRGQPFMIMDIFSAGTAADVAGGYKFIVPPVLGEALLAYLFFHLLQGTFQDLVLWKKSWKYRGIRAGLFTGLLLFTGICGSRLLAREHIALWNVNKDYVEKGYLYTLARESGQLTMKKPEFYSVEKVREIIADAEGRSTEEAEGEYKNSTDGQKSQQVPENLLVIMNESLADLESVGDIKTEGEILKNIHALSGNVKKGYLHVPGYGGGTAQSEYEVLTGNSTRFLPPDSAAYQLYIQDPEYGLAYTMADYGYETVAMHPNRAANWNRTKVYEKMGFDQFLSSENWGEDFDIIRKFASDQASFHRMIRLYEEKDQGEKLFAFCVTMQNHGGYGKENQKDYQPDVKLHYEQDYPEAETYLSLARESDQAFQELVDYFEKVDEPTMIVMFGDHWPQLEEGFVDQLFGKNAQDLDLVETQQKYETPYVIWTNYPMEASQEDMSTNYFGSYILKAAGIQGSAYNQFLLKLKETIPVIGNDAVCDSKGNWYSMEELPKEYVSLIEQYQILQYNNLFDRENRQTSAFIIK